MNGRQCAYCSTTRALDLFPVLHYARCWWCFHEKDREKAADYQRPPLDVDSRFPLWWRVRRKLDERHGQACRIVRRGKKNTILVEFAVDGHRVTTSGNYVRKRPSLTDRT